jgi:hypothetical protein
MRMVFLAACLWTAMNGATPGGPVQLHCEVDGIVVAAPRIEDARLACVVSEAVDGRLRALGLHIAKDVRIEITEELDIAPEACVAFYSTETRELQVLTVDCLADQPGRAKAFPSMRADLLFESLIVHELVHAYVEQSSGDRFLPRLAHEYLAYAIQLDALPDAERDRVLAKAGVGDRVELGGINEAVLGLSPLRFAALAWLHFTREGGDAAVVARVLDGSLTFNSLRE